MKPYFAVIKQLTDWNKEPESVNGSIIVRQKTSSTGILKFYTSYSYTDLSLNFVNLNTPASQNTFSNNNNNLFVNTSYKEYLNPKWLFFIGSSFTKDLNNTRISGLDFSSDKDMLQSKAILTREFKSGANIKFGGEIQNQHFSNSYGLTAYKISEVYTAGFVETEFFIGKSIAARAGGRFENSKVIGKSNVAPRASLALKTSENSQVSVAYGDFYQTAEYAFLYKQQNLDFEKASHYIINYQWIFEKRVFRIEAYEKRYDQLLRTNLNPEIRVDNSGNGYARGLDVFWRDNKKTFKNVDFWISYSYIDTKRFYHDFPISATPNFVAKNTASLVYKHWIPKIKVSAGATYTYATGRPYYNPNKASSEFNSELTPYYQNASLNISKLTSIKGHFTIIYASANNIFGRKNVFGYKYSDDGTYRIETGPAALRTFFVGLFISIDKPEPKE